MGAAIPSMEKDILDANLAITKMLGYDVHELRQVGMQKLLYPEELVTVNTYFDEMIRGDRNFY